MSGYLGKGVASAEPIDPPGPLLQKPFAPDGLARIVRQVLDTELAGSRSGRGVGSGEEPALAASRTSDCRHSRTGPTLTSFFLLRIVS